MCLPFCVTRVRQKMSINDLWETEDEVVTGKVFFFSNMYHLVTKIDFSSLFTDLLSQLAINH
jgi:hypothetical protein